MKLELAIALIAAAFAFSAVIFFLVGTMYRKKVAEKQIGIISRIRVNSARRILIVGADAPGGPL